MTENRTSPSPADRLLAGVRESLDTQEAFFRENRTSILAAFRQVTDALRAGGKLMIIGNGGSAADAQHVAAELVNRFERDRPPLAALALTTDSSILTSVGNDADFRFAFSRQVEALGRPGDVLLAISTSGNSPNVLEAVHVARARGVWTLALTGGQGGTLRDAADATLCVGSSSRTCRIQEALLLLEHLLCEWLESELSSNAT